MTGTLVLLLGKVLNAWIEHGKNKKVVRISKIVFEKGSNRTYLSVEISYTKELSVGSVKNGKEEQG